MDPTISLQRAVEVAEHNDWYRPTREGHGPELVVFETLTEDNPFGFVLTVEPTRDGFRAEARDGVGKACVVRRRDERINVLADALAGYLHIVNKGI